MLRCLPSDLSAFMNVCHFPGVLDLSMSDSKLRMTCTSDSRLLSCSAYLASPVVRRTIIHVLNNTSLSRFNKTHNR